MSEEGPSFSLQSVIAKPIIFVPLCIYYVMTAASEARVIKDTSTSQDRR